MAWVRGSLASQTLSAPHTESDRRCAEGSGLRDYRYEATAADDPNTVCKFVVEKRILQCHLHQERVFSVASKVFSVSTIHELWGNVAAFWQLQCPIVSQTIDSIAPGTILSMLKRLWKCLQKQFLPNLISYSCIK